MNKIEFLEYALDICTKEIEEDIKSNRVDYHFSKLQGLKDGLYIAEAIMERDWSENIMTDFIKDMIENI